MCTFVRNKGSLLIPLPPFLVAGFAFCFCIFIFILFLHIPFSLTVHLTIVHNMIPSHNSGPLGPELLIGEGRSNQCWCHWLPQPCPAIVALHSSSEPSIKTKIPQGKCYTSRVSLVSDLYLVLHPDISLVLSPYEVSTLHDDQSFGVDCFLFSSVRFFVHLSTPLLLLFYPYKI